MSSGKNDLSFQDRLTAFLENSKVSRKTQLLNFPKYADRQHIAKFLAKYEIFRRIVNIPGAVVECGVYNGGGLMSWANFSAILEPYNYIRKIVGFDSYEGLPPDSIGTEDVLDFDRRSECGIVGGAMKPDAGPDEMLEAVNLFNMNRPIGHVDKVELIVGKAEETIPSYLNSNPQLAVALLALDFNLYKPTKVALENLFSRIPKGGVVIFDDFNSQRWPGETKALEDVLGIHSLHFERIPFEPVMAFAVVE